MKTTIVDSKMGSCDKGGGGRGKHGHGINIYMLSTEGIFLKRDSAFENETGR